MQLNVIHEVGPPPQPEPPQPEPPSVTHAGEGPAIATSRFVVQIEGRSESNGVLVDDECNAASQEDGEDEEEEVNGSSQQSSALLPSNGRSDKLQSMVSYGAFYFIDFFYYFNALG